MVNVVHIGSKVRLLSGEIKKIVDVLEEDENHTLFILDDLNYCSWLDIVEVIEDECY